MHKKGEYNDAINKYLQKMDDHRRRLLILREESIENYKAFKKSYTNENNGLTIIDTSSEENVRDPEMTHTGAINDPYRDICVS